MPKKSSTMRASTQRQRPKAQKSIALVRPNSPDNELVDERANEVEETEEVSYQPALSTAVTSSALAPELPLEDLKYPAVPLAKGNASARLAARRQGTQRVQIQRNAGSLVTTEHFAYVRRDLIFIAILAIIMIAIILIAYFVFGRGAA